MSKSEATKVKADEKLNARDVKFNVKSTPLVRTARASILKAIVSARGREKDLDGLQDTLEVLLEYLEQRKSRDCKRRAEHHKAGIVARANAAKLLEEQKVAEAESKLKNAQKEAEKAEEALKSLTASK